MDIENQDNNNWKMIILHPGSKIFQIFQKIKNQIINQPEIIIKLKDSDQKFKFEFQYQDNDISGVDAYKWVD